jgi:predicted glycosyltransferase
MVVDVSVEVALLARLASVPVVYVRLNGDRSDPAHLECFRAASGILAPFHEALEAAKTPAWVRKKTTYFPGVTSFASIARTKAARDILIVIGRGGPAGDGDAMSAAARSTPDRRWRVIGPCSLPRECPTNLEILGWVQDPDQEIAEAALVVGAAGDGLVTSMLAADRPFICLPQARPYGEQQATAEQLELAGAALVVREWPSAQMWPGLVRAALQLKPQARQRLHDPRGLRSVTNWIVERAATASGGVDEQAA